MTTFLALSCIKKWLRYTPPPLQNCVNILKCRTNYMPASQNYVTKSNTSKQNPTVAEYEWKTLYRLPLIPLASAFNRVKIPYGIFNIFVIPTAFALEQYSQLPPSSAILVSAVGLTSWCTLSIASLFVRNLIGIIYINDNNDKLKLAYVDYWGKRHDVYIDVDDVIPECEKSKPSKYDFYQSLCLQSDNTVKYKLLPRFGSIEDRETFIEIFGN